MIRPEEEARRAHSKVPISHLRQSSRVSHSQCMGDFSNEDRREGKGGKGEAAFQEERQRPTLLVLALLVRLEDKH